MHDSAQSHHRPGFTIVELLITMTLVSILAAITWLQVEGINARAYRSSVQSDLRSMALAQELYFQENMQYGDDVDDLEVYIPTDGVNITMTHADRQGFAATANHQALGGVTCGYFTGTVPAGAGDPAGEPDVAVCD